MNRKRLELHGGMFSLAKYKWSSCLKDLSFWNYIDPCFFLYETHMYFNSVFILCVIINNAKTLQFHLSIFHRIIEMFFFSLREIVSYGKNNTNDKSDTNAIKLCFRPRHFSVYFPYFAWLIFFYYNYPLLCLSISCYIHRALSIHETSCIDSRCVLDFDGISLSIFNHFVIYDCASVFALNNLLWMSFQLNFLDI